MTQTHYTKDHEYIRVEGQIGTVGITNYAQAQLGDVVFVELPDIGKILTKGEEAAVVESVKAASEVYAPVSGTVSAVNSQLESIPGLINEDSTGTGWFFKVTLSDVTELSSLMSESQYQDFLASLA
jgi:glycine cleavage system H protein